MKITKMDVSEEKAFLKELTTVPESRWLWRALHSTSLRKCSTYEHSKLKVGRPRDIEQSNRQLKTTKYLRPAGPRV